jgi:hypothetical protein
MDLLSVSIKLEAAEAKASERLCALTVVASYIFLHDLAKKEGCLIEEITEDDLIKYCKQKEQTQ